MAKSLEILSGLLLNPTDKTKPEDVARAAKAIVAQHCTEQARTAGASVLGDWENHLFITWGQDAEALDQDVIDVVRDFLLSLNIAYCTTFVQGV